MLFPCSIERLEAHEGAHGVGKCATETGDSQKNRQNTRVRRPRGFGQVGDGRGVKGRREIVLPGENVLYNHVHSIVCTMWHQKPIEGLDLLVMVFASAIDHKNRHYDGQDQCDGSKKHEGNLPIPQRVKIGVGESIEGCGLVTAEEGEGNRVIDGCSRHCVIDHRDWSISRRMNHSRFEYGLSHRRRLHERAGRR